MTALRIPVPAEAKQVLSWFHHKDPTIQPSGYGVTRLYYDITGKRRKQRVPTKYLRALVKSEQDAFELALRLNGKDPKEEAAKEEYQLRAAWLSPELIRDYEAKLRNNYSSEKEFGTATRYLHEFVLGFFINFLKEPNVNEWVKKQELWARYLLNKDIDPSRETYRLIPEGKFYSKKVLKYIVNEANRFLKYVHRQKPDEVPFIKLEPFDKPALASAEMRRIQTHGKKHEGRYIPKNELEKILEGLRKRLDESWAKAAYLCYCYGLRTNECVGQDVDVVKNGFLLVSRQLIKWDRDGGKITGPVKDREARKVPHWNMDPNEAYDLIYDIDAARLTGEFVCDEFGDFTEELFGTEEKRYLLKDLRKTWCTNMLKLHSHEEVRLAAGHADLKTTLAHYVEDSREMDEQTFVPKKRKA